MRSFLARLLSIVALSSIAACGGGGSGGGDGGGGGPPGGATWRSTALGDGFAVLESTVSPATVGSVSLAVDGAGAPVVAYAGAGDWLPRMRRWDGAAWTELGTSPAPGDLGAGGFVAAATTPAGEPVLVWAEDDSSSRLRLRAARFSGGAWVPLGGVINPSLSDAYLVRAVSTLAGPVVAWWHREWAPEYTSFVEQVRVARFDGLAWVELGAPRALGGSIALTALPDGTPVLGYREASGPWALERWDAGAGAWVPLPALGADPDVQQLELASDATGALYASTATYASLSYAVTIHRLAAGETSWGDLGVPPGAEHSSSQVTLAGLPGGGVAAAWIDATVLVARHAGAGWESITPVNATGSYTSLRPMIGVVSRDELYVAAATSGSAAPRVYAQRWKLE